MVAMGRGGRGGKRASTTAELASVDGDVQAERDEFDELGDADQALSREFEEQYEFNTFDLEVMNGTYDRLPSRVNLDFPRLKDEYATLWAELAIRRAHIDDVDTIVQRITQYKERYRSVEQTTNVPWFLIAIIHILESGGSFKRHLHNGDPLTERTVQVPAGRPRTGNPPFSWEESATDALEYDKLVSNKDWSVEKIAYLLENFNGWGYRLYHPEVKSPYLWSFSNHYTKGKYVADGKWSPDAVSRQCGSMVILKRLEDRGIIRLQRLPDIFLSISARQSQDNFLSREDEFPAQGAGYDAMEGGTGLGLEPGEDEEDHDQESYSLFRFRGDAPKPVPESNPVPFAQSAVPATQRFWPVISDHPKTKLVSYKTINDDIVGRSSRQFLASRSKGRRYHVAIDLFANHNDEVVACEDGIITNFYGFYPSSAGEMTYAIIIEHSKCVINYGEVKKSAPREYNWRIGSRISAGQKIARVSTTSMLHFETYLKGTTRNYRWRPGERRPRALLNPTAYLLEML